MNKARQRKLDARQRRQESLANSGAASQEPRSYPGRRVSEERLGKIYRKIGIQTIPAPAQPDVVKDIRAKKKKKNLAGIKKITVKGKEKKNG